MNGHIIEGTPIAVDFWKVRECPNVKLFFLSHVHDDHTKGLTPSWRLPLYTSPVSAKLLAHFAKVPSHLVKALEVGTSHLIPLGNMGKDSMTVTLIDAQHCPGAVMFLFEGYFGTFLYTGDFRYDSAMADDPAFAAFPPIDRLYLDNTYCSPSCTHPTRPLVTEKILEAIRAHPPDTRVLFGLTRVGKEDLLVNVAQELKEWIVVDPETYTKMRILEMSDVFTVDDDASRIRVLPFHVLNRSTFQGQGHEPFIAILPSSIIGSDFRPPYGPKKNFYPMPYSNHSSFPELAAFVSRVRPRFIIPIVSDMETRSDMSGFENLLDPTPCKPFETPLCVENWIVDRVGRKPPLVVSKRKRKGMPKVTKGVSFIDEDSCRSKLSGKDGDNPNVGQQQANGTPKHRPAGPSKQASRDTISSSDCDSDSGIFAVLKKLKPQADDTNGIESSSSLASVVDAASAGLMSGTGVSGNDASIKDVAEADAVDLKCDSVAASMNSEELLDPPASPDPSLEPGPKPSDCQTAIAKEASKTVNEVNLNLSDSADELFMDTKDSVASPVAQTLGDQDSAMDGVCMQADEAEWVLFNSADTMSVRSTDIPALHVPMEVSPGSQTPAAVEGSKDAGEINSSLSDSSIASDALIISESSPVKGSSQEGHNSTDELIGSSQASTSSGTNMEHFAVGSQGSGTEAVKELQNGHGSHDEQNFVPDKTDPKPLGTAGGPCGPEILAESGSDDNEQSESSQLPRENGSSVKDAAEEPGSETSDRAKRFKVPEGAVGPLLSATGGGEIPAVIDPPWKPEACLCKTKWSLEEALQEAMAYAKGEAFQPFVYPDQHVCLL